MSVEKVYQTIEFLRLFNYLKMKVPTEFPTIFSSLKKESSKEITVRDQLNKLLKRGLAKKVDKRDRGAKLKPGETPHQYFLTKKGMQIRSRMIEDIIRFLEPQINQSRTKIAESETQVLSEDDISQFIMGFAQEFSSEVEGETLKRMSKYLIKEIKGYF